jgi:hypothetical protein
LFVAGWTGRFGQCFEMFKYIHGHVIDWLIQVCLYWWVR